MVPGGFVYVFQIKFLSYFYRGSAVPMQAEYCYYVLVLCFKRKLWLTARSLALFPLTISVQNTIKSNLTGTERNGYT